MLTPIRPAKAVKDGASGRERYASNVMPDGLDCLNDYCKPKSLAYQNDSTHTFSYVNRMAKPKHDWYLKQWLQTLGKKQADITRDLDWNKARVSLTVSGKQQYTRDDVNEISRYLNLRPYELLMHPNDAMRMRRLRNDIMHLAHDSDGNGDENGGNQKVSHI